MQDNPFYNITDSSFWNTCYNANGIQACATFSASIVNWTDPHPDAPFPWTEPNQFLGGWQTYPQLLTGSEPFYITAWGMKFPTPATLDVFYADDAWGGVDPNTLGWTGFSTAWELGRWHFDGGGTHHWWDFAVGGNHYEGAAWSGYWIDRVVPSLAGTTFAWHGETADHRLAFDCIQAEVGSTQCIGNDALSGTTTTPEPATLALLLTGFALVALVRRYTRRMVS